MSSTTGARPPLRRLRRAEFLPPDERVEVPYRFTPKLALRVGILGLLAVAVFAVLLFRLWALQVLSGTHYLTEAQNNQVRTVRIEAARGTIVDVKGRPLVTNVPGTIVRIWPQDLPKTWARQLAEFRRLAAVLNMSPRQIVALLKGRVGDPLTPVTIKSGVHRPQASYILEHQDDFRGVDVHSTTLRHYPHAGPRCPSPRARRGDLARPVEGEDVPERRLPRRRPHRAGRSRGRLRRLPAWEGGARPVAGRRKRAPPRRVQAADAAAARRHPAAHARPPAPAGGRARDQGRHQVREGERVLRLLGRERRCGRRPRSAQRSDQGARLVPDVQAERLRRACRREEARGAGSQQPDREEGQLPRRSTARSPASIRRDRRSSRSRRSRRCRST